MVSFLVTIAILAVVLLGFNILMGYRKGNITLDLNERYTNLTKQAEAVKQELKKQGKTVDYEGNGYYIINGKRYVVKQHNVAMGGVPLQRTVLTPAK
ncbi:hypothetical protein [Sporosarcina aquimarina]|uniref:Uncharacterized protein n=1 Tax=Sporosarcina aquimarina TaxID=114975 RepID=A0ABU4G0N9_9BACL|nr:hypothetical protein [Sporosarcina aquimarina]MDW0110521.1 hypothetical protein [Sporosarcina aquimarina]